MAGDALLFVAPAPAILIMEDKGNLNSVLDFWKAKHSSWKEAGLTDGWRS